MIDRSEVLHIALLSRLQLSSAEVDELSAELSGILAHFDRISELDLEGVEPSAHAIAQTGLLRDDVPADSLSRDQALDQAPATDGVGFEVPAPGGGGE